MYTHYYGLSTRPFSLTPDPDFLYLSRNHKEALAHLTYGVESKSGFVLVTGEVGAGKTTLIRTLIKNLGTKVILSHVTNTRVNYRELLELVLEDFGVSARGLGKTALLSTLNDFLIERFHEGKNCVLIVDEAQNLGSSNLEGLRLLSNLETEKSKLLHTILTGQPGLRDLIDSPELEQLRQRITVRYHLGPLSPGEVGEYVRHRIRKAAADPERAPVFPDEVIPSVFEATGGIPRLINVLCDEALLHGYVENKREIDKGIVDEVAQELRKNQSGRDSREVVAPEPSRPSDLEKRIERLEARVDEFIRLFRGQPDGEARDREQWLEAREKELRNRAADLEKREAEFNRRLETVKDEWKRRMRQLESSRQGLAGGAEFPPPKVYLCESDQGTRKAVLDLLETAGIGIEAFAGYEDFCDALKDSGSGGWFSIAVLGADLDDTENLARILSLAGSLAHVPLVFLSDIGMSTLRRKSLSAGASCFLEKPNGRAVSLAAQREAMENFRTDLLRAIQGIYRQYKAFYETFVEFKEAKDLSINAAN